MKKISFVILIAIIFVALACNKESENYSFYRPSHPQNFKTKTGGELYAYTANDSTVARADYYLKVQGKIRTYGSSIVEYGHVYSTSPNPIIGPQSVLYKKYDGAILEYGGNDTSSYVSTLSELVPNTKYYVRSYVKELDSNKDTIIGYNPIVSEISTLPAIDEWFEQFESDKPLQGSRFDAIAFNFGDSLFFGTGNQGGAFPNKDMYMFNPSTQQWDVFPSISTNLTDGIGFAVEFKDNISQQGTKVRCIYVGLGNTKGNGDPADNINYLMEYEFKENGNWVARTTDPYWSGPISGAVAFVLGDKAYIGSGKSSVYKKEWYVYIPANDRDGNSTENPTFPWKPMTIPGGLSAPARIGAIAFAMNGRGYFGLGVDEDGNFLKDFWEFRPNESDGTDGTWTKKADFIGAPRKNAVAFAIGDQGYVGTGDNIPVSENMEAPGGISSGEIFNDFYRYDPFNNKWHVQQPYTANKTERIEYIRPITRAVGVASPSRKVGFIGYGIIPENYPVPNPPLAYSETSRAQEDFWKYQPYEAVGK